MLEKLLIALPWADKGESEMRGERKDKHTKRQRRRRKELHLVRLKTAWRVGLICDMGTLTSHSSRSVMWKTMQRGNLAVKRVQLLEVRPQLGQLLLNMEKQREREREEEGIRHCSTHNTQTYSGSISGRDGEEVEEGNRDRGQEGVRERETRGSDKPREKERGEEEKRNAQIGYKQRRVLGMSLFQIPGCEPIIKVRSRGKEMIVFL
ncbi:hypothetical protein JZ751_024699 [Albula glossodonta]|uniref:Uncharacterized protein n=1 Tax=Albula glossodonta TaxID=121402 RepID=A0A8T2PFB3_9TELE|nr:hypothetical protein JZ751_024699 [Albula glossodonta]